MFVTAQQQVYIFLMSALCGVCLGAFYDLFKILRRLAKASVTAANVQDGIFWLVAAAGVLVFLLIIDDGRMRFYELGSIFLFWLIYELTLSRYTVRAGVFIAKKTLMLMALPVRLLCRIFKKPAFVVVSISRKSLKRAGRILKNTGRKWYEYVKNFKKMRKKI